MHKINCQQNLQISKYHVIHINKLEKFLIFYPLYFTDKNGKKFTSKDQKRHEKRHKKDKIIKKTVKKFILWCRSYKVGNFLLIKKGT